MEEELSVVKIAEERGTSSLIYMEQVKRAVEALLSEDEIQPQFYQNIDSAQEFGVSRFLADRMAYLSRLLENTVLTHIQDSTYLVSAEIKDRNGNALKLEHRFKATTGAEAQKIYEKISSQLAGTQQKIWLACWRLANELCRYTYTCQLTDLMKITYPNRDSYFSVSERTEFFEHLKGLEQTKILFSIPEINSKRKKALRKTFEIHLLEIRERLGGEEDKYPQQITLSIMNHLPNPGKMAFVGTAFKHQTLELHADDTALATWIQTIKSQRKEDTLQVERDFLIQLAGLQKTDQSNKTVANRQLVAKLTRLVEKGILEESPFSIEKVVSLKIR
jgi:hypothetical protein